MGPGASDISDISDILPELLTKLDGLERSPTIDPEQARFRLFFSIATFLKNLSQHHPLVLVLEDLHWADESSLLLLEFVPHDIGSSPILVIGTYRDIETAKMAIDNNSHGITSLISNTLKTNRVTKTMAGLMIGGMIAAASLLPGNTSADTPARPVGGSATANFMDMDLIDPGFYNSSLARTGASPSWAGLQEDNII